MSNPFAILAGFLERFGREVEGRELREPPEEIRAQLRAFARGTLPEKERSQLLALLYQNPGWLNQLADEVKALRSGPGAGL